MSSLIVTAVLAVCPKAAEIDFRPLPPANTVRAGYKLKLTITTAGGDVLRLPLRFGSSADPEAVADSISFQLEQKGWKYTQDGVKLTVYGTSKSPVVKVQFETDVAKPIVRWRIIPPPKK